MVNSEWILGPHGIDERPDRTAGGLSTAPEWVTVAASRGDDGGVLVPLEGAWLDAGDVIIAFTADQLGDAPTLRAEADLTPADTVRASVHYAPTDQDPTHA